MTTSTTYDPETKIATVSENGYEVASNDYNSLNGFECELGMTEEKKQEFSLKMDNEKNLWDEFAEDNYDVASEQTQR